MDINQLGSEKLDGTVSFDDITLGDIVGDMHGHQILSGKFKDWEMHSPFELTEDMFTDMWVKLNVNKPVSNKMGYIVSAVEDVYGNASQLMVIYQYDFAYHCTFMIAPQWKKLI